MLLPAVCEAYNLRYVGADAYAHALCADKSLSKKFCKQFHLKTPEEIVLRSNSASLNALQLLQYPVVVKPNFEGSSIGISDNNIADSYEQAVRIVRRMQEKYNDILIEEYIEGQEIAICIVGGIGKVQLFEAVKLLIDGEDYFKRFIWGYESKKGGNAQQHREVITNEIELCDRSTFLDIFYALGKVDYMRIDCRVKGGEFYLIELTPDCSLHPDCFMSKAFTVNGYTYTDMIFTIISSAMERYKLTS